MEQRKRIPTGTWEVESGVTMLARKGRATGEFAVARPPEAPLQRPVLDALARQGEQIAKLTEQLKAHTIALKQLADRAHATEQYVAKSAHYYSEQAQALLLAVEQTNLLHTTTNQLQVQQHDRITSMAGDWQDLTSTLKANHRLQKQAKRSPSVAVGLWLDRNRGPLTVGCIFTSILGFVAYAVIDFSMR